MEYILIISQTKGKLEIRVPREFTPDRPPILFERRDLAHTSIYDHDVAKHLPEPQEHLLVQPVPDEAGFRSFVMAPNFPASASESVDNDTPQILLYITSFSNATLVALSCPHTLLDGTGFSNLFRNWSRALAGEIGKVEPVIGAKEDVLEDLDRMPDTEPLGIEYLRLQGFKLMLYLLYTLWHRFFYPPKETRHIYLPRGKIDALVQSASDEDDGAFLSKNDILSAWLSKAVSDAEASHPPITFIHLVSAHSRIKCLAQGSGVYLQNIVGAAACVLAPATGTLRQTALRHRALIKAQTSDEQLSAFFRPLRESCRQGKPTIPIFADMRSRLVFMNNLTGADFMNVVDFSPAVVGSVLAAAPRANPAGKMVNYLHFPEKKFINIVDNFYVLGKDHAGGYWLMGTVADQVWKKVDAQLDALR